MSESSMTTVINRDVQEHIFKWTIMNFSKMIEQFAFIENGHQDPPLKSSAIEIAKSIWRLYVFPKFGKNYIAFELQNEVSDPDIYETKIKTSILHSEGEMDISTEYIFKIPIESVRDEMHMPNDTLTVKCHFEVFFKYKLTNFEIDSGHHPGHHICDVCSDLMALLDIQTCSDVTLRCNGSEFPAHKAILSARSPVFFRMFQHDMIENQMNVVDIPDIKAPALEKLLDYIYGKKIGYLLRPDICFQLYEAADKYQLLHLKQNCASVMARNLSLETVCDIAVLADVHSDSDLFTAAKSFVREHAFVSQLIISKSWVDFVQASPGTASLLIAS